MGGRFTGKALRNSIFCAVLGAAALTTTQSFATPSVLSISGSTSEGGTITVAGTGFGTAGPTVSLYDNFDKGSAGATVPLTDPSIGAWAATNSYAPTFDTGHGGGFGMRTYTSGSGTQQIKARFTRVQEALISYWVRVPNAYFPNTSTASTFPTSSSWKMAWIMNGDDGYKGQDDLCLPSFIDGHNFALSGNGTGTLLKTGNSDTDRWFSFSDWMRITVYLKGGAPDPSVNPGILWVQAINGADQKIFSTTSKPVMGGNYSGAPRGWTQVNFPGWLAGGASLPTRPVYDDVYIATGPNARARVEIGNASTYSASTNLTLATVSSWSDKSISAQVRKGSFAPGSTAYLYVSDASGAVNTNGYQIVMGGSSTVPSAPTNVSVTVASR